MPTLESAMLRGAGVDEVEGHMGRPTDVLVREGAGCALVAPAHQPLAHKVHDDHKHQQDEADDQPDGGGAGGQLTGWRGQELCGGGNKVNVKSVYCPPACVLQGIQEQTQRLTRRYRYGQIYRTRHTDRQTGADKHTDRQDKT